MGVGFSSGSFDLSKNGGDEMGHGKEVVGTCPQPRLSRTGFTVLKMVEQTK